MSREAIGNYLHTKEYDDATDFILMSIRNKISLVSNMLYMKDSFSNYFFVTYLAERISEINSHCSHKYYLLIC